MTAASLARIARVVMPARIASWSPMLARIRVTPDVSSSPVRSSSRFTTPMRSWRSRSERYSVVRISFPVAATMLAWKSRSASA